MNKPSPYFDGLEEYMNRRIGQRLKRRRQERGVTQTRLSQGVGVTYQQIQKYESGQDRIAAARLFLISALLSTSAEWFFE